MSDPEVGRGSEARRDGGAGRDPEAVLSQALRAMAGGQRVEVASGSGSGPGLTRTQILLIAAIVGLVIGMAVGFTVLAMR